MLNGKRKNEGRKVNGNLEKGRRDGWTGRKEMRREGRQSQTRKEKSR